MSDVPEYADWCVHLSLLIGLVIPGSLGYSFNYLPFESAVISLLTAVAFACSWLIVQS